MMTAVSVLPDLPVLGPVGLTRPVANVHSFPIERPMPTVGPWVGIVEIDGPGGRKRLCGSFLAIRS